MCQHFHKVFPTKNTYNKLINIHNLYNRTKVITTKISSCKTYGQKLTIA
ncbi:hypothetical protein CRENPOLYSF1_10029 [Crenothrix polyspora]|uniref:Uncharacterized protein n=1 Tax=Crenothrix polyspora TaxID=360316 RepID=A0A1R4GYJ1_9GAMM|nr:hypothetical protein CRENPOLYSF1_10029 [Crenothrix polyspora]